MFSLFRRTAPGFYAAFAFLLLTFVPAAASTRVALVLGNGKYQNVPELENPSNDAQDLAQALRGVGFDVIEQHDATRASMSKAVHDFSDRLTGADVALFFYAGHGLQMNGENYLLPVDAQIQNAADVRLNSIHLSDIQQEMESDGHTNIIILDACRNNPFADKLAQLGRSIGSRGLMRMDAEGQGLLIIYSTQPNHIASDGAGRNSPFTAALLKHIATPGLEVRQMVSRVRGDVLAATDKKQTPWDSSSLVGDVYLTEPLPNSAPPPPPLASMQTPAPYIPGKEPAAPQMAASSPQDDAAECDKIAAQRIPFSSSAAVHEINEANWLRGADVCTAAVEAHPGEMRFVYELGRAQDHLKNYIEALHDYKTAASAGFVEAMVDLGAMYYLGHGVIQSYPTAFDHFSKAAAAGSNRGMANLAAMYGDGVGVAKDDTKSLDLAEKAIEAGNPFGLKIVADHYFNGAGVPRDYPMAAQYLQQAADIGDGQSMKFLANMYESGYLGPPNPEKAGALRLRA